MNALMEITRMIEECSGTQIPRTAISQHKIQEWMVDKGVLTLALEGKQCYYSYKGAIKLLYLCKQIQKKTLK
jgi:hypothetical protein